MLARLWHHRIIRRDDEHRQIEPRGASQHVANKFLMPRHVDQGELEVAQLERGESKIDRDAAFLLGREAIGVDARQRIHEGRLTMVNMTGRAEHEVARTVFHQ